MFKKMHLLLYKHINVQTKIEKHSRMMIAGEVWGF